LKKRYSAIAILIIVVVTVSIFAFLGNQQLDESALLPETTTYTTQSGIRYADDSNPYHIMDVYLPEGNGPFPAIIYIHGGGWAEGSRSDFGEIAQLYAKRGIAGFSIDYTLAAPNRTAWPQNIEDVISALTFIQANAANYRIDTQKIAVMGSSAGAHLASLIGTLCGNESFLMNNFNGTIHSQVCLVINYDGVEDLEFVGQNKTENVNLLNTIVSSQFGGVTYSQNPDLWKESSPVTYISTGDPTFVFVHGVNDRIVPIQVAQAFNAKLEAASVETHFIRIEGDHDILTNEAMNMQARNTLDPILKSTFALD
jgi:acetyl esterase/lipase